MSAEKTGRSGWASFCESVSASMAAPEVLSESTEEFTNTLASWLRFCSCSSSLSLLELLFFRHNTTQQTTTTGEPSWKSGSSTSSCYCSLSRACKVLSLRSLAENCSRALSLLSFTIFQRLLGRRSRLLFTTHTEGNFSTADVLLLRCVLRRRRFSSFDTPRQTDQ